MGRGAARDVRRSDGGDAEAALSLVDERGVGLCLKREKKRKKERSRSRLRFFRLFTISFKKKLKKASLFSNQFHSLRAPLSASITSLEMFLGPGGDVIVLWGVSDGRFGGAGRRAKSRKTMGGRRRRRREKK